MKQRVGCLIPHGTASGSALRLLARNNEVLLTDCSYDTLPVLADDGDAFADASTASNCITSAGMIHTDSASTSLQVKRIFDHQKRDQQKEKNDKGTVFTTTKGHTNKGTDT